MTRGAAKYSLLVALSALSLGLCAGAIVFWIRSFWVCDAYRPAIRQGLVCYQSYRGALHYVRVAPAKLAASMQKYPPPGRSSVPVARAMLWQEWNGPTRESYSIFGFAYTSSIQGYTIGAIPYWRWRRCLRFCRSPRRHELFAGWARCRSSARGAENKSGD